MLLLKKTARERHDARVYYRRTQQRRQCVIAVRTPASTLNGRAPHERRTDIAAADANAVAAAAATEYDKGARRRRR